MGLRPQRVRNCGLPVACRLFPGPRCVELRADLTVFSGEAAGLYPDDVLDNITITVDEHGDFRSTPLLGKQTPVFQLKRSIRLRSAFRRDDRARQLASGRIPN